MTTNTINSNTLITIPLEIEVNGESLKLNGNKVESICERNSSWGVEVFTFKCNHTINIADEPAYVNVRWEFERVKAMLSTEKECREHAQKDLQDFQGFLNGTPPAEYRLHIRRAAERFTEERDKLNQEVTDLKAIASAQADSLAAIEHDSDDYSVVTQQKISLRQRDAAIKRAEEAEGLLKNTRESREFWITCHKETKDRVKRLEEAITTHRNFVRSVNSNPCIADVKLHSVLSETGGGK